MKWTVTLSTICLALAGCQATGDAGGTRTFSAEAVPFTFEVPGEFTGETVDRSNSRGDVVAAVGLTKVDLIAVRRASDVVQVGDGPQRHEVLGKEVTSELHPIEGAPGFLLECQFTDERAEEVRSACRAALESVARR